MAIARLTHLRLSIPSSGAPPGQVPAECFPDAVAPVAQPRPRRVSFAEEVTTLNTEKSPEISPMSLPLTQLVVEEMEEDTPTSEVNETQTTSPESGMPLPPGIPSIYVPGIFAGRIEFSSDGKGIDSFFVLIIYMFQESRNIF